MPINQTTAPLGSAVVLTVTLTVLGGCASGGSYHLAAQSRAINELTAECYWRSEGERLVFGAAQVHSACRSWARGRVEVHMPSGRRTVD